MKLDWNNLLENPPKCPKCGCALFEDRTNPDFLKCALFDQNDKWKCNFMIRQSRLKELQGEIPKRKRHEDYQEERNQSFLNNLES